jgi:hypothetical protein
MNHRGPEAGSRRTTGWDSKKENLNTIMTMNSPIKILSALTIGGFLAGSAFAGPGDAHPPFSYLQTPTTKPVTVALFRSGSDVAQCPMAVEQTKWIFAGGPRNPSPIQVVTGYKMENCTMTSASSTTACNSGQHGK